MARSLHFERGLPFRHRTVEQFYIAPYEQFISGWPSPERSQMTRSLQLEPGSQFLPSPHQRLAKPRKVQND